MVVALVVGRMEGEWGPSPSNMGFPRAFWRREELGLQLSKWQAAQKRQLQFKLMS